MTTVDAGGIGPAGATNGAIGSGVTAFQTKVVTVPGTVTMAGARAGTSPIQICAVSSPGGVRVIRRERRVRLTQRQGRSGLVVVTSAPTR